MSHTCNVCGGRRSGAHRYHRTIAQMAVEVRRKIEAKPHKRIELIAQAAFYPMRWARTQSLIKEQMQILDDWLIKGKYS